MPEPITSWTSAGMSWASLNRKMLWPYIEALRLALVERCTAAGVAVPARLASAVAPGWMPPVAWGQAFDSTMSALFGRYVNHLDSGGDWSGAALSAVAPAWTEAALLAAIGAPARLTISAGYLFTAAWAAQQYALLNLLRWTRPTPTVTAQVRSGQAATHAGAQAAFAAGAWTTDAALPGGIGGNLFAEIGQEVAPATPDEAFAAFARRPVLTWALPATLAHRLTVYFRASRRADERGGGSTYDEPYYGTSEAVTAKVLDESTGTATASRVLALLDFDTIPIGAPGPGETRGFDASGLSDGVVVFLRWDAAGGFAFLA